MEQWLESFAAKAPWDAARKGSACLDVSIGRALQFEVARTRGKKRAALFVDLSTFYETISHHRLEESALRLNFPMTLLNVAFVGGEQSLPWCLLRARVFWRDAQYHRHSASWLYMTAAAALTPVNALIQSVYGLTTFLVMHRASSLKRLPQEFTDSTHCSKRS